MPDRRRALPMWLVVFGLLAGAVAVTLPPVRATAVPPTRQLYAIGDSVLLNGGKAVHDAFPDWPVTVDGFRAIFTDTAAQLAAEHAALVGDTAIIATGYNHPYWSPPPSTRGSIR